MKKTGRIQRKTPLKAKKAIGKGSGGLKRQKGLKKANPERQKKAAKRGAAKHRAYMASETRKIVEARSGGRCEAVFVVEGGNTARCGLFATDHHHKTYARYGGNELPEDIQHLCQSHHDMLEAAKPAGNRRSRAFSSRTSV